MYAKKRKDQLYQCTCTTIGINALTKCDTYLVLPKELSDKLKREKS